MANFNETKEASTPIRGTSNSHPENLVIESIGLTYLALAKN
tara:strand:- start:137 stop:259 length:123 start_codon:yes stop_codon:yes gene_type:complete